MMIYYFYMQINAGLFYGRRADNQHLHDFPIDGVLLNHRPLS